MRTALLFCGARRTALCQRTLEKSGFAPQIVRFSDDTHAVAALGRLLEAADVVCILGPARGGKPAFGAPVFAALGVPMRGGEPDGVLRLLGSGECIGYLVESQTQAVALLPDRPGPLQALLPELSLRLHQKYARPAAAGKGGTP